MLAVQWILEEEHLVYWSVGLIEEGVGEAFVVWSVLKAFLVSVV